MSNSCRASLNWNSEFGLIQLHVPSYLTANIPPGKYFYDLFVTYLDSHYDVVTGATVSQPRLVKIMEGVITMNGRITRNV